MSDYNRHNPFFSKIKERFRLNKEGSKKHTHHVVLDLSDSGLEYTVGDSLAVIPQNDPTLVNATLDAMNALGTELISYKQEQKQWVLREFLTFKANITEINRKLLQELELRQTNIEKKTTLQELQTAENRENLKNYLESIYLWDLLKIHSEVKFTPQEIADLLMPLLPRFYSIASSSKAVGQEAHLTIALVEYTSHGINRKGVCTHYLCLHAPIDTAKIPIYIQPSNHFRLPPQEAPMIMIGPGTGVAPYRGFMQERITSNAIGKNWLFFGEQHEETDFLYEDFWRLLEKTQKMRLSVAFSRDQEKKLYVQHRMEEEAKDLFDWIENGAYLYVCGDAKQMAKDVEKTLLEILEKQGNLDEKGAKEYLKKLRHEKRYLRDVY